MPIKSSKNVYIISETLNNATLNKVRNTVLLNEFGISSSMINVKSVMDIIKKNATVLDEELLQREILRALSQNSYIVDYIEDVPSLSELITEKRIILRDNIQWEDAFRLLGNRLLKEDLIEQRYVNKTIDLIKEDKPFITIAPNTVVAHAPVDYGVNEVSMSFLISKDIININDYLEAYFILFLATPNYTVHLKALDQFIEFISQPNIQEELLSIQTSHDVHLLIENQSI